MTENAYALDAQAPRTVYDPGAEATRLDAAQMRLRELIEHVGHAVGAGVTPNLHARTTDVVDVAWRAQETATFYQGQLRIETDRHAATTGELGARVTQADELTRLLEQARSIACKLEYELTQTAAREAATALIGLPVIVDFTIAPGTIVLRDAAGTTLATLTNVEVDAEQLQAATVIALGADEDDTDDLVHIDLSDIEALQPLHQLVDRREAHPFEAGLDEDRCGRVIAAGSPDVPASVCALPSDAAIHSWTVVVDDDAASGAGFPVAQVLVPNDGPLPDRVTPHEFLPIESGNDDRCARMLALGGSCGADRGQMVHLPLHPFVPRLGSRACGSAVAVPYREFCGFIEQAACHADFQAGAHIDAKDQVL